MCGLIGVYGSIGKNEKVAFLDLMEVGKTRGKDATGIASVSRNNNVKIVKRALNSTDFLDYAATPIEKALEPPLMGILGHHRLATMGENTDDNAHPFKFDKTTGIHNGVLGYASLDDLPSKNDHPVDSGRLFYSLAKSGIDPTLAALKGDWALIWYDEDTKKFWFIRNSGRPLWYRFSKTKKIMWTVSEPAMGTWIVSRNGLQLHEDGWKSFEADKLYSLDASKEELELTVEREVKGKPYTVYTPSNNVFTFPRKSRTYEEWLEEHANDSKPLSFGQAKRIPKDDWGVVRYSFDELQSMTLKELTELQEAVMKAKNSRITQRALGYINLAQNNWSEYVTWRQSHRQSVTLQVLQIDNDMSKIDELTQYSNIIKGQIDRKQIVSALSNPVVVGPQPLRNAKSYVELWSDVQGRVRNEAGWIKDYTRIFTKQTSNVEEWLTAHADPVDEHIKAFIGTGNYITFDDDLEGKICISWTKDMDVNDKSHRDLCKKIHAMLDYFVGPRIKMWDKNDRRLHFFNDFNKSVDIKHYGMDWKAPSSNFVNTRLSQKVLHDKVRQAVEGVLNGTLYINPVELAETMYKLAEPRQPIAA